ncbi:MAG: carbonic anhydrase [Bacteroidetes bacterium]|nr:carbonic anhydrase [Bacteroidota bacterium]
MPYKSPQVALQKLKEGNVRFVEGKSTHKDYQAQVQETSKGQYPFAIILSCMDSRSPSEIIFDVGIGDIFNVRIAGNIVDEDVLGSMEFACKVTGSKLILVMGHTNCGAIRGACDNVKLGNLTSLLEKIMPAVNAVPFEEGKRNSDNDEFVEKVSKENVMRALKYIRSNSPILKEMLDEGEIMLVGSMYDVATGKVTFYE